MDRYTKIVLTVIAGALVYICIVLTPIPSVSAQAKRPGEIVNNPIDAVIVGVRLPKETDSLPVSIADTVRVQGSVTTERSSGRADRVVVAGWEEVGTPDRPGRVRSIDLAHSNGLPVTTMPR